MDAERLKFFCLGGAADRQRMATRRLGKDVGEEGPECSGVKPELIAAVRAGDQGAARVLVEILQPAVLRIVRTRRPRRVAEEDLTQEIFMKMFARLGQYLGDAPFAHWVARIALTTCLDHGRAQKRRPEWRWADLEEWETEFLDRVTDDRHARRPGELWATRNSWKNCSRGEAGGSPGDRAV